LPLFTHFRYCNREFDDEKILIQHQKAKHFKCHICHKKLYTGPGLAIHCMQVHKETIDKIPNALPNRHSVDIEIYGMEGMPEADIREHERQKGSDYITPLPSNSVPSKINPPSLVTNPAAVVAAATGMIPPQAVGLNVASSSATGYLMPNYMPGAPYTAASAATNSQPNAPNPYAAVAAAAAAGTSSGVSHGANFGAAIPPPSSMINSQTLMNVPFNMGVGLVPNKPLFPSVSGSSGDSTSSTIVGADFKPLQGSLSTGTLSAGAVISKPASTVASFGSTSKIIHPEEDISLEELRARQLKYKLIILQPSSPSQSASTFNGLPTNNISQTLYSTPPASVHVSPIPNLSNHPQPASFQPTFRPAY